MDKEKKQKIFRKMQEVNNLLMKGYQPIYENLDPNNPPKGGTGVPPLSSDKKKSTDKK